MCKINTIVRYVRIWKTGECTLSRTLALLVFKLNSLSSMTQILLNEIIFKSTLRPLYRPIEVCMRPWGLSNLQYKFCGNNDVTNGDVALNHLSLKQPIIH